MRIYLSLGTNLGDRTAHLDRALALLSQEIGTICQTSSRIETAPVGFDSPHPFLNAVTALDTSLPIETVLQRTQAIERQMGRTRKSVNGEYADRIIDIDILAASSLPHYQSAQLLLPHPHLSERRFVLAPWAEIAPDFRLPCGDCVADLLLALDQPRTYAYTPADTDLPALNTLLSHLSAKAQPLTPQALDGLRRDTTLSLYITRDETGAIVGMVSLSLCQLPTGCKAWAEDLVVLPEMRGKGMGKALILRAEREARRHGATTFNFTSQPDREAANRLYTNLGYERRHTNVYRRTFNRSTTQH